MLILDEPTSGIGKFETFPSTEQESLQCIHSTSDPYNRRLIWSIIRRMREAGRCIILTTHFLEEADVLSDRIAIMTNGRLQAYGTPNFLKNRVGM